MLGTKTLGLMACCTLLLAACGQAHRNRQVVEDFMTSQMGLSDYDVVEWSEAKPTYFVSDSMMQVMRAQALQAKRVRPGVAYAAQTSPLQMLRVKYAQGRDTVTQTFYLNRSLDGVVGFKDR